METENASSRCEPRQAYERAKYDQMTEKPAVMTRARSCDAWPGPTSARETKVEATIVER